MRLRAAIPVVLALGVVAMLQLVLPLGPRPDDRWLLRLDAYVATFAFFLACSLVVRASCMLDRSRAWQLWLLLVVGVGAAVAATFAHADVAATSGRLVAATAAGLLLARMIEELWWVAIAGVVVTAADMWSVFSSHGVTHTIIKHAPDTLHWATVPVPILGIDLTQGTFVGVTDLLFLALFLACAWRWQLGMARNAIALSASFVATLAIDAEVLQGRAIPALPLLALAVVLVNARALWRSFRTRPRTAR